MCFLKGGQIYQLNKVFQNKTYFVVAIGSLWQIEDIQKIRKVTNNKLQNGLKVKEGTKMSPLEGVPKDKYGKSLLEDM